MVADLLRARLPSSSGLPALGRHRTEGSARDPPLGWARAKQDPFRRQKLEPSLTQRVPLCSGKFRSVVPSSCRRPTCPARGSCRGSCLPVGLRPAPVPSQPAPMWGEVGGARPPPPPTLPSGRKTPREPPVFEAGVTPGCPPRCRARGPGCRGPWPPCWCLSPRAGARISLSRWKPGRRDSGQRSAAPLEECPERGGDGRARRGSGEASAPGKGGAR